MKVTPEWLTFCAENLGVAYIPYAAAIGGARGLLLLRSVCSQPNTCPDRKLASRLLIASWQA